MIQSLQILTTVAQPRGPDNNGVIITTVGARGNTFKYTNERARKNGREKHVSLIYIATTTMSRC